MFSVHTDYAEGIWTRNNHESFWISVLGKLGKRKLTIVVAPSKSFIFEMFYVHIKTKIRRFQIPTAKLKSGF